MNPEETWSKIREEFLKLDDVQKQGEALKIKRKMFVFFNKIDAIVVKLPKNRVSELLESKEGLPYDPGNGKIMKEWIIIPKQFSEKWFDFSKEGMEFAETLAK